MADKPQTKTSFILSFKPGTPAKEIVEEGKKKGIKLTDKLVYAIRSDAKAKKKGGKGHRRTAHAPTSHSSALRALILDVGYTQALALLEAERARLLKG